MISADYNFNMLYRRWNSVKIEILANFLLFIVFRKKHANCDVKNEQKANLKIS